MNVIDLHGIRHKDVSDIITRHCVNGDVPFVVITGKSPQMKRIVSAIAREFGMTVRDTINNPGRVIVND